MTGLGAPCDRGRKAAFPLRSPEAECAHLIEEVSALARANGAVSVRASRDEAERLAFRAGRKAAFPAVGRLGPDYCMDGAIPRRRMPEVLARMGEMSKAAGWGAWWTTGSRWPRSSRPGRRPIHPCPRHVRQ